MDSQEKKKYIQTLQKASLRIKTLQAEVDGLKSKEPVAIIGMGCHFPGGAESPDEFWKNLTAGLDAITKVPDERWDISQYYNPDPAAPGGMITPFGGFIEGASLFDNFFFGISTCEASSLDPQQRLLLQVSWHALEDAGLDVTGLNESRTAVFIGITNNDFVQAVIRSGKPEAIDAYSITGVSFCTASGRISYTYGFQGPNCAIDTACSSSLVALHFAVQSLESRESDLALAGGVNLILTPEGHIGLSKLEALSPDGRCKAFDASADGFSPR
ncbi:MAG: beta-ketoacyl synthase N-terminal-like domain-containing protein [Candidatus Xenobiia bacterium LiM19]